VWYYLLNYNSFSPSDLDERLAKFYAFLKTIMGELLKSNTLIGIRHGINRYIIRNNKEAPDVVHDPKFSKSNQIFKAILKKMKREGKGDTKHFEPISKEDLQEILISLNQIPQSSYSCWHGCIYQYNFAEEVLKILHISIKIISQSATIPRAANTYPKEIKWLKIIKKKTLKTWVV